MSRCMSPCTRDSTERVRARTKLASERANGAGRRLAPSLLTLGAMKNLNARRPSVVHAALAALAGASLMLIGAASCSTESNGTATTLSGTGAAGGSGPTSSSAGGEGGGSEECTKDDDCMEGYVCEENACVPGHCTDGVVSGDESDVDCGGTCLLCPDGMVCGNAADCINNYCEMEEGAAEGVCASCTSHDQCDEGGFCDDGVCVEGKELGAECDEHAQCGSGFCPPADGVCCETNCDGVCEACLEEKTGEADGTCAPVLVDTDPDAECGDDGAASCGSNATGCNGDAVAPACNVYPDGTECAAAACSDGMATPALSCDGAGTCVSVTPTDCGAYACDSQTDGCLTSCSSHGDCADTHFCSGSNCVPKKNGGDGCTEDAECGSGFCPAQDGVCCDSACSGLCESCLGSKTGGSNGVCDPVSNNTDPDNECSQILAPNCDGAGQCG